MIDSLIAAATIRGRRLFPSSCTLVWLLFKVGVYSRAVSFRGNTVVATPTPAVQHVAVEESSSAAAERAFLVLNATLGCQQQYALQDYVQSSPMLRFNKR